MSIDSTSDIELTNDEVELLLHFAIIGQSYVIARGNHGDREVAKLEPLIERLYRA